MTPRFTAVPATAGVRTLAYLIDLALVAALSALAYLLTSSIGVTLLVAVQFGVAFSVARAASGYTPGGWLTGTVAHAADTARAPGLQAQVIRSTLMGALHLTLLGPLITVALTKDGRDWVDRIAGTATVKLSRSEGPAPARHSFPAFGETDTAGFEQWAPQPVSTASGEPNQPWPSQPPSPPQRLPVRVSSVSTPGSDPAGAAPWPAPAQEEPHSPIMHPEPQKPIPTIQEVPAAGRRFEEPSALPAMPPSRAPIWVSPDTGTPVELNGVLVLGREPSATEAGQIAVPVPDPTRSLSRTHMRIGHNSIGVWVEDCYSTNGTFCQFPDGRTIELTPGIKHQVPIGSIVLMGDRTCAITQG
ncbi:MAG: RDD family protein [Propionibacteriaceae bacterium]|nr:RDD family protein [Propionibacteriaceae bacterium]